MSEDTHLSVMQVRSNLIASLPPHPTDSTIDELQTGVLERIDRSDTASVEGVILDVSAVETVDSFFARTIVETAKMVELLGVHPVLVGISPAIAITAIELGFDLGAVETALSTDEALEALGDGPQ